MQVPPPHASVNGVTAMSVGPFRVPVEVVKSRLS
jgi:hypothetical protein